jgi:2-polyprenyl-3-methyl-5-hydroxy-6-metoxy-1,4-benzoquinol methylase
MPANDLKYYDKAFFKHRLKWRADYDAITGWINTNIDGQSFGDIGCGSGIMIENLHKMGKKVWGVDGAPNFERYIDKNVRKYVKTADLTKAHAFNKTDVALCFEVAERIDEKYADKLIKSISTTKADVIMFTAAQPFKAGVHHVNLQTRQYWLDKFKKHRYYLDVVLTEKFKRDLSKDIKNLVWYLEDIKIFRRCDDQKMADSFVRAGKLIEELGLEVEDFSFRYEKMKYEYWMTAQELNRILASKRWKLSGKLIKLIKR